MLPLKLIILFVNMSIFPVWGISDFNKDIKPLLEKYCVSCHGPEKQKAKLRMDVLNPDLITGPDAEMWQEALDLVNTNDMPPEKSKAQPTRAERQLMVEWMTGTLRKAMETSRSTGGKNVMRRLTSYEYNNTLRDLLYLDTEFATDLPPEGAAKEGFKNNNKVLGTSALHIEYFERIAREALEKIIIIPEKKPKEYFIKVEPEFLASMPVKEKKSKKKSKKSTLKPTVPKYIAGKGYSLEMALPKRSHGPGKVPVLSITSAEILKDKGVILAGNRDTDRIGDVFAHDVREGGAFGVGRSGYQPSLRLNFREYPNTGPILIRIKAAAILGEDGAYPRLSFELGAHIGAEFSDQKEGANFEVKAPIASPQVYEFVIRGENFPFLANKASRPQYFRIFNDFRRGTSKLKYEELPKLLIDSIEIRCNYYPQWPPEPTSKILILSNNKENEQDYLKKVLQNFMNRAYRRPVAAYEVERKIKLYHKIRPQKNSFKEALVSTLTSVLCSSNFLMLPEPQTGHRSRELSSFELASRLSYFLWSTMPDDILFSLATRDELIKPEVLRAQVHRMLQDTKSSQFVRNFTSQWLDLDSIHSIAINPEFFSWPEKYKYLFKEESIAFVDHVLKENLSIENFIDSDFAVLNPIMAKLYRIPEVAGGGFSEFKINKSHHRGGLLTHASMLFANSTGSETHPIRRGVWLLERLLNDPPPPPPPNVPDLEQPEEGENEHMSLKQRLASHAQLGSCSGCHSKIDPWGVAFENYNALGQWREGSRDPLVVNTKYQKVAIDPSTELKNGKVIKNLSDLKNYILTARKDQFTKAVVNKVMSYGLGRYVEFHDQKAMNMISEQVKKDNYRFRSLIEHIVLSEPFLTK